MLALPVVLWQLWSFLAPAFDPSIERNVLGLVSFATALGAAGLAFGYWIVLPRALQWLTHYDDTHFTNLIQAKPYYSFTSTVLLGIVMYVFAHLPAGANPDPDLLLRVLQGLVDRGGLPTCVGEPAVRASTRRI